ncbi:hypothetical protein VTI74DRAFT_6205 [Chaetomium olivicolor]
MTTAPLKLDFVTLDVFTDTRFLGNPLAVVFVPAALRSQLSQQSKQRIADEFNLSETVFLHTLDDEPNDTSTTRQIDIFTIGEELTFAGHPTIGTAYLVKNRLGWSHVDTLLTRAGPIPITSLQEGGAVRASIPHAVHIHRQTLSTLLSCPPPTTTTTAAAVASTIEAGLSPDADIRAAELSAPVVSIVRGMTFLLIELPTLEHLSRAGSAPRLDFAQLPDLLDEGEWHDSFVGRYYYVVLQDQSLVADDEEEGDGRKKKRFALRTRMLSATFEDPATGSAASALASYLTIRERAVDGASFRITQGVEMGRRSEIEIETVARVEEGESGEVGIKELFLGGTAVEVMSGSVAV